MLGNKLKEAERAIIITLLAILLLAFCFWSMKLPLIYKILIPFASLVIFIWVILVLFDVCIIPKRAWICFFGFVIIVAYFLCPVFVHVEFVNTKNLPIDGIVLIDGSDVAEGDAVNFFFPRGDFEVTYTGKFRAPVKVFLKRHWHPLPVWEKVILEPAPFNFEKIPIYDPNEFVELFPQIKVAGKSLDNDAVDLNIEKSTLFPIGEYDITFSTQFFEKTAHFSPQELQELEKITLYPNNQTVLLGTREVAWIENFMREYLELSAQCIIQDKGFPKQLYLYSKNATLSLGDMLFVLCQKHSNAAVFFSPKNQDYFLGAQADECYPGLIQGTIPASINGVRTEQFIYDSLSSVTRTIPFSFGNLNQKQHLLDWAMSFDIEYGRYVPEEGKSEATFSTCEIISDYLTKEQCENADLAGWVSESSGIWWFGEYDYPVSSGVIGWRYILELSDNFGIPTTQYLVLKDIDLFKKKDAALFALSKELVDEGLVEVGSHTKSHPLLGKVPYDLAMDELSGSKKELEILYNTTIFGFRNPYLSLVQGDSVKNEQALAESGYSYYSLYGDYSKTIINNRTLEHKPINFYGYMGYASPEHLNAAISQRRYIISLDHPWNIYFTELETDRGILLEEQPKQPVQMKALILEALSKGVHFTTVEEITVLV